MLWDLRQKKYTKKKDFVVQGDILMAPIASGLLGDGSRDTLMEQ
jgi:hypothetical protein